MVEISNRRGGKGGKFMKLRIREEEYEKQVFGVGGLFGFVLFRYKIILFIVE